MNEATNQIAESGDVSQSYSEQQAQFDALKAHIQALKARNNRLVGSKQKQEAKKQGYGLFVTEDGKIGIFGARDRVMCISVRELETLLSLFYNEPSTVLAGFCKENAANLR